jgi:hypothetical protein
MKDPERVGVYCSGYLFQSENVKVFHQNQIIQTPDEKNELNVNFIFGKKDYSHLINQIKYTQHTADY